MTAICKPLTHRERDIVALIVNGASEKDIAAKFNIASRTVKFHTVSIYKKFGLRKYEGRMALINKLGHFELLARWIPNALYKKLVSPGSSDDGGDSGISHDLLHR